MKNAAASVKEVTVMATPACFIACENKSLHVHNICFDLDSLEPLSLLDPGCHQDCPCTELSQTCRPHLKYNFSQTYERSYEVRGHGLITDSKEQEGYDRADIVDGKSNVEAEAKGGAKGKTNHKHSSNREENLMQKCEAHF